MNRAQTKRTFILKGVSQEDRLSPTLFNVQGRWLDNESLEGLSYFNVAGNITKKTKYANDVVQITL